MKKIFLSLLAVLFTLFVVFFGLSAYQYYKALHGDDPIHPFVSVESGALTVVRADIAIDLTLGEQYDVMENDVLISKKRSLATVHWPDHSVTRLGENTRMHIQKMRVATDYSSIEIAITLEQGKSWNTVVRTLYPGSYFRVALPKDGIIAGVRGTVFDIDLANGYIRSMEHGVTLTDLQNHLVTLLPGDIVSATDITKILPQNIVDTAWSSINQARDASEAIIREDIAHARLLLLGGGTDGIFAWWDSLVGLILSQFPAFSDIPLYKDILQKSSSDIWNTVAPEKILGLYQQFQDKKFVQERDWLRGILQKDISQFKNQKEYLNMLLNASIWDAMSFSGMELKNTRALLENPLGTLDSTLSNALNGVFDAEKKAQLKNFIEDIGGVK